MSKTLFKKNSAVDTRFFLFTMSFKSRHFVRCHPLKGELISRNIQAVKESFCCLSKDERVVSMAESFYVVFIKCYDFSVIRFLVSSFSENEV